MFQPVMSHIIFDMQKSFRIGGDFAIGGIIRVFIKSDTVTIGAYDYGTNRLVMKSTFAIDGGQEIMYEYLNYLTNSHNADKIFQYINAITLTLI